jgi:hypothetical protein
MGVHTHLGNFYGSAGGFDVQGFLVTMKKVQI